MPTGACAPRSAPARAPTATVRVTDTDSAQFVAVITKMLQYYSPDTLRVNPMPLRDSIEMVNPNDVDTSITGIRVGAKRQAVLRAMGIHLTTDASPGSCPQEIIAPPEGFPECPAHLEHRLVVGKPYLGFLGSVRSTIFGSQPDRTGPPLNLVRVISADVRRFGSVFAVHDLVLREVNGSWKVSELRLLYVSP